MLTCLATTDRTARLFVDQGALEVLNSCHFTHRNVESAVSSCTCTFAQILSQDIDLGSRLIKSGCVKAVYDTLQAQPGFKIHSNTALELLQTLAESEGLIDPLTAEQKTEIRALLASSYALIRNKK